MAFVDNAVGGRVVTAADHSATPVTLTAAARVGDLLAPSGAGWAPAASAASYLISAMTAPAGTVIRAYRTATIDFGPGCTANVGDPLYSAAAGGYTTTAGTVIIGRMLTPSVADITPTGV